MHLVGAQEIRNLDICMVIVRLVNKPLVAHEYVGSQQERTFGVRLV